LNVGILSSFYPEIQGGAETSLALLLEGLRALSLDPIILTLSKPQPNVDYRTIPIGHFADVPKRLKLLGLPGLNSILSNRLIKILSENRIDILHVNDTWSLRGASKAAEPLKIPLVLSYHNNLNIPYSSYGIPYPFSYLLDARERGTLNVAKKSSMVLATSNYIARRLVSAGLSPTSVKPIYIGGAIKDWGSLPIQAEDRPIRVLSVGVIQYHKGIQNLLLAVRTLATDNVPLEVVIAGAGPYLHKLLDLARDFGVANQTRFTGWVDAQELTELYDWCDTTVVPTLTPEPFGRVAVEAMSRGRPVIGTNHGGLAEIIEDNETGYLVPPGSPTAIADRLLLFRNHPNLLAEMGKRALARCKAVFDQRLIAKQVLEVYDYLSSSSWKSAPRPAAENQ